MSMRPDLDIAEIRAFAVVARTGGFRAASEELRVAQSSISQRINRLEQKLRRPLISRTTRSVELTEAGKNFHVYATAILGLAESVRHQFDEPPLDGVLKLGITEDYATRDLPALLAAFKRHYPRFAFTLKTGVSANLFRALEDEMFDVVLAKRLPGRTQGDLLFSEPLTWVGDDTIFGMDEAVPLALCPEPSETRQSALCALRDAQKKWSIVLESESVAVVAAAARAGLALAVLVRRLVPEGLKILNPGCKLPLLGELEYVIDSGTRPRNPAIDAFVSLITAAASSSIDARERANPDHQQQIGGDI